MHIPLLVGALTLAAAPAQQAPDRDRTPVLLVTGSAQTRVKPDQATVTVGAVAQAKTAQAAQNEVNRKMQAFLERARRLIGEKGTIQTGRIGLSPVYSERPRRPEEVYVPEIIGYRADSTVVAQLNDFAVVGPLIDAAVEAGLNSIESVSFGLRDDTEARVQALVRAVAVARLKATAMAAAAEVELAGIWEMSESAARVMPYEQAFAGRAMAAEAATPVLPGEVTVHADVVIRFFIRPKPG